MQVSKQTLVFSIKRTISN